MRRAKGPIIFCVLMKLLAHAFMSFCVTQYNNFIILQLAQIASD